MDSYESDPQREEDEIQTARRVEPLGESEAFMEFNERLSRAARVDRPVLLIGERGTGKELAASRLHYLSPRWEGDLIALNCAALSPTLIESELFGHEAGAFTGATRRRPGRFETASGGTLFLDEIAAIPIEAQEKILRVVEYGTFERVGSSNPIQVDTRIIGATNADLPSLAKEGKFKEDLLDRLSFEVLFLPPLRERIGDISLLANHFAMRIAFELNAPEIPEFSDEATSALLAYSWPGNVRELKNVVERAVHQADSHVVTDIVFDPFHSPYGPPPRRETSQPTGSAPESSSAVERGRIDKPLKEAVEDFEIRQIKRALRQSQYNQRRAAELLGLTYNQFRGLYRKYNSSLEE